MSPPAASEPDALFDRVADKLGEARDRIARAGGEPERVRIVAVTKGFGPDEVAAAFAAGLRDVGENYADERSLNGRRSAELPPGTSSARYSETRCRGSPGWSTAGRG